MAEQIVAYERVADGEACEFCNAVEGATVNSADPMPLHDGCGCGVVPITGDAPAPPRQTTGEVDPATMRAWEYADDEMRVMADAPEAIAAAGAEAARNDTFRAAAASYSAGGYKRLNAALREGEELTPEQAAMADALRAGMRDLPDGPVVWRGVRAGPGARWGLVSDEETLDDYADWAEREFQPGAEIELGGFQSTSYELDPAIDAAIGRSDPGIIFEIVARRGVYLGRDVAEFDDESELLLPDNTRYRVVGVIRRAHLGTPDSDVYRTVVKLVQL